MTPTTNGTIAPEEYLKREACAETKSEYIAGALRNMAGASPEHDTIGFNLIGEIRNQTRGSACRGGGSDLRVWIEACQRYYYPDVTVTCGPRTFELREGLRALTNPTLIVEVLSTTTEAFDRGEKFLCYQQIESLSVYLLVSQTEPRIEMYVRAEAGVWRYTSAFGLGAEVIVPVADIRLRLGDVFEGVEFAVPTELVPYERDGPGSFRPPL